MMGIYTKTLEPAEVEDLLKYYCVSRGLQYQYSDFGKRAVSIKVFDPLWPLQPTPTVSPPTQDNYCTKHSLNHGKKYPSCRLPQQDTPRPLAKKKSSKIATSDPKRKANT